MRNIMWRNFGIYRGMIAARMDGEIHGEWQRSDRQELKTVYFLRRYPAVESMVAAATQKVHDMQNDRRLCRMW